MCLTVGSTLASIWHNTRFLRQLSPICSWPSGYQMFTSSLTSMYPPTWRKVSAKKGPTSRSKQGASSHCEHQDTTTKRCSNCVAEHVSFDWPAVQRSDRDQIQRWFPTTYKPCHLLEVVKLLLSYAKRWNYSEQIWRTHMRTSEKANAIILHQLTVVKPQSAIVMADDTKVFMLLCHFFHIGTINI
jgi:hypothetical protein